jgi:group I intron endonuclease
MSKIICGIYKITNPSGKIYIGEAVDIHRRWRHYKGLHCKRQPPIYNSLLKYGVENHLFEIAEECLVDELKCRERYWQEYYDVLSEKGLNCQYTECGELKQVHTQETKDKISKAHKGKVVSEETKQKLRDRPPMIFTEEHRKKISVANSGAGNYWFGKKGELNPNFGKEGLRGEKHPFWGLKGEAHHSYGLKASKETKEKQSNSSAKAKIVLDLNTGVFYKSCKEASLYYDYNLGHLRNMLSGSRTNKTTLIFC